MKNKYKEYTEKKVHKFDIFKMKLKNYDKEKEEMLMRKEEIKKLYPYRKIRALYGTRLKSNILKGTLEDDETMYETHLDIETQNIQRKKTIMVTKDNKVEQEEEEEVEEEVIPFKYRIIIKHDASWKSVFDVVILLLVGYSCITSLFYVAFISPPSLSEATSLS